MKIEDIAFSACIFPRNVVFAEQPTHTPLQLMIDKKSSTISDAAFPSRS
jgi:hypothetical protein